MIKGDMSEEGQPTIEIESDLKCNFQDKAKRILNEQQQIIELSGRAYFNGDIAPYVVNISHGHVVVFGITRKIYSGTKARNPDGTVNYTLLELL